MSADEGADLRQARILLLIELRSIVLLRIHIHGAELIELEGTTLIAYTLLGVDDIPIGLLTSYQDRDDEHHGREEDQRDEC